MSHLRVTVDSLDTLADDERVASLVTDDGRSLVVPVEMLPEGTQPGDVMTLSFQRNIAATEQRKRRVAELQRRLFGADC